MTINLKTKDDFNAARARSIRKMLLQAIYAYIACALLSFCVSTLDEYVKNTSVAALSQLDRFADPYDRLLGRDKSAQARLFSTIIDFAMIAAVIYFMFGMKKLSDFTRTPLFRYYISGVILSAMYVGFCAILFISNMSSDNVGLKGLSVAFCGIISVAFVIYMIYLYYKIAAALREISAEAIFTHSFKWMSASLVVAMPLVLYVMSFLLWNANELTLPFYSEYFNAMMIVGFLSSVIAIIAQVFFIIGVHRIKTMEVRE